VTKVLQYLIGMLSVSERDLFNMVFSLVLAIVIGIIISQLYKITHRGLSYELTFMATLVTLAPIVAIVMLFIRGDLVLSLGLIGSLSIVRFRTPVKDTRDMVFIFWIIAVGLGCGTYNWIVVIVSTIVITILIFVIHTIRYGQTYNIDYVLVIAGTGAQKTSEITEAVEKYAKDIKVRSKEIEGEYWEIIFEIRFNKDSLKKTDSIIDELRAKENITKVSLLAPQTALPV
jgi:hypothetical protein